MRVIDRRSRGADDLVGCLVEYSDRAVGTVVAVKDCRSTVTGVDLRWTAVRIDPDGGGPLVSLEPHQVTLLRRPSRVEQAEG